MSGAITGALKSFENSGAQIPFGPRIVPEIHGCVRNRDTLFY